MVEEKPDHDKSARSKSDKKPPPRPNVDAVMKTVLGGGNPKRDEYER